MERCEVVYRMSAEHDIDGVEVHEVADVMYAFATVVEEALRESGEDGELKVHVKPFRKGSFVTEFVLTYGQQAVNLFSSIEATALSNALTLLGFKGGACGAAVTLPKVIKKVRGKINEFRSNEDGTYTYGSGEDEQVVDGKAHAVIQSPKIAKAYKTVTVGPIIKIDKSINISIQSKDDAQSSEAVGSVFTNEDVADMEMYELIAVEGVPSDSEEIVSTSHDVVLSSCSGPYDGGENGYTFKCDDQTFRRVQMHDLDFKLKLEKGEVRLMNKDLLVVDMEVAQTIVPGKNTSVKRTITKVNRYIPYSPVDQMSIEDA